MFLEKRKKNQQNSMILMKQSRATNLKKSEMLPGKDSSQSTSKIVIPNGQSFSSCYIELCKKRRLRPLPVICVTLPYCLDFTTDRVKMDDWNPILNALSLDHTLKSIAIRSRYQYRKPLENVTSEVKARSIGKAPVVFTKYLLEWLSHSVSQCVRNSTVLTSLVLEGIPLPPDCLAVLCVGLASSSCLRHLSLFKCYIGDVSCEMICRTIADVSSIRTLNLGQCDLSSRCASALAAALSRQKLLLFHDAWKQSLRYREPNLDAMPGLRRLTLNGNPRLGDSGVNEILEAIVDSLWLKALDLQQCGLTDVITNDIMDLLDYNESLVVVDVRMNNNLQDELAQKIAEKLERNNATGKSEYKWFSLPKKNLSKAIKRIDRQEDLNTIQRKNKRIKNLCLSVLPKSAPCKTAPVEALKGKQSSSRSIKLLKPKTATDAKQHLLLNLNAQMESCDGPFNNLETGKSKEDEEICEEMERCDEDSKIQIDIQEILIKENQNISTEKDLEDVRQQLEETQREHELLLERTKQNEILLIKERIRRETTETKLRLLKNNLTELENALKEKEQETRGYLLVSQSSLDEICSSFDNLLDMLDSTSRNRNVISQSEEEMILRDEIRTKMALLIRKTKSESFKRGYFTEEVSKEMIKFARSEADMRSILPLIDMIHFEKNIGDSPDLVSSTVEENVYKGEDRFWKKENSVRQMGDNSREEEESFRKRENSFLRREDSFRMKANNGFRQVEERSRIRKDSFRNKENSFQNREDSFRNEENTFRNEENTFRKEENNFRKIIESLRKGKEKKFEFHNLATSPLTKERARAIFIQIVNGNMLLNLTPQ